MRAHRSGPDRSPGPGRDAGEPPPDTPPGETGFRFHGDLRSGFGVDGNGKGQQPFIAPMAGAKYRLGNEAETYLETTFACGMTSEGDDPAYFDTRITLAYVTPTSQSSTFATTFSLREASALARRVWTAQPDATFWAGARFYDRNDVPVQTDRRAADHAGAEIPEPALAARVCDVGALVGQLPWARRSRRVRERRPRRRVRGAVGILVVAIAFQL
jgi:maltoporin